MRSLILSLLAPLLVSGHIWFPDDYPENRRLTTEDCNDDGEPSWTSTSSTDTNFLSFHLHIAWAAGNTAQVNAVNEFKAQLLSTGGASSSCTSIAETADYFCFAMTLNDYSTSNAQVRNIHHFSFSPLLLSFFSSVLCCCVREKIMKGNMIMFSESINSPFPSSSFRLLPKTLILIGPILQPRDVHFPGNKLLYSSGYFCIQM
jgi:hypothetical protein